MVDIYSFTDEPKPFDLIELNNMVYDAMEKGIPFATKNTYTIYIPSKARSHLNITPATLQQDGLEYKFVVEPQDYDAYVAVHSYDRVVRLDKNDMGVAYVRNFIKQYSRSIGELRHWQLDDDIEKFFIRKKDTTKNVPSSPLFCISLVEYFTDMFSNVAVSGICSTPFAFSKQYAVQVNRLAYQCMLIDNTTDIEIADLKAGVDWDYTLRSLEAGYCTLAFHHVMQQSAPTMKYAGGNTNIAYVGDKRKRSYEQFISLWPGRFVLHEVPTSTKRWRLKHVRKFFNDYKQRLVLKT